MSAMERREERERLLAEVEDEIRLTAASTGIRRLGRRVRQAMLDTPRHLFVPAESQVLAYENRPLPIGQGQTISQPYIVALMTELLAPKATDVILEVGTGSGYQAAVLARLVKQVYSIETVAELARTAATRLEAAGIANVHVMSGDGSEGWPEQAPFDGIIVTAAAPHVPPALTGQLKPGGRLVIPIGQPHDVQELVVISKDARGRISRRMVLPVAFVPLVTSGQ